MFSKKKSLEKKTTSDLREENPYAYARYEWNERYRSFIKEKNIWQIVAILTSLTAIFSVFGVVYIGSQSKYIPYLVEVDKLGQAMAVKELSATAKIDPRIVRFQLAEFISDVRTVTSDGKLKKKMMSRSAYFCSQYAYNTLVDFWSKNQPFEIAKVMNIEVQVQSVLPVVGTDSWQVEWTETQVVSGIEGTVTHWQGIFEIGSFKQQDQNIDAIMNNPTGLLIKSISWSQVIQ